MDEKRSGKRKELEREIRIGRRDKHTTNSQVNSRIIPIGNVLHLQLPHHNCRVGRNRRRAGGGKGGFGREAKRDKSGDGSKAKARERRKTAREC